MLVYLILINLLIIIVVYINNLNLVFSFYVMSILLFSLRCLRSDVPDRKLTSDEEEAKRIAEMGKPVLGEHSKLEVIIEESYEFKVGKRSKRANTACV